MRDSDDPGRLARDAYTYLHLPLVAGIIAAAVGDDLLIAHPEESLHGVGLAVVVGGPALYLVGENLFRRRMTGTVNPKRFVAAGALLLLAFLGPHVSALALCSTVAALLLVLALWEYRSPPTVRAAPAQA